MTAATATATYPLTLYYESACPLCNAEMSNLMLRNTDDLLRFVDISAPGFTELPPGTSMEELMALMHGLKANGEVIKGVDVFRLAYRAVGLHSVAGALQWPVLGRLADRLYPWIARHRHHFPRALVHLLFETAVRRAAEQAAARASCKAGQACRI